MPGIGLIKRRLEKEEHAVALATSHILKNYNVKDGKAKDIAVLETKYHDESGDWYVALGWERQRQQQQQQQKNETDTSNNSENNTEQRAVVQMDSILGTVTCVREI